MPTKKYMMFAVLGGIVAGFMAANAKTGEGIYSLPFGKTLADTYVSGSNAGFKSALKKAADSTVA